MTDVSGNKYGRSFDGTHGDVLKQLEEILANTPSSALVTRPIKRALLEVVVTEIRWLRGEMAALQKLQKGG